MNREFLDFYNRELKLLYERAGAFAAEFPGVAERLGDLTEDRIDPGLAGLLEGAAFMAARVQMKIKGEFEHFTTELLESLLPGFLAPVPSFGLLQAFPDFSDTKFLKGFGVAAGSIVDTTFVETERRSPLRYRLTDKLTIWPYDIAEAKYYASPAPIHALGIDSDPGVNAGLHLVFRRRSRAKATDEPKKPDKGGAVRDAAADALVVHISGPISDAVLVYEQLFSRLRRMVLRYEDENGELRFRVLERDALQQIGFSPEASLFGDDDRIFGGFGNLRDYFSFPAKFLGFRLTKLAPLLSRIAASRFDVVFEFDTPSSRLASVVKPAMFAMHAVPIANLFEMQCSPIQLRTQEHEYAVTVDRSRTLDHEVYRILEVLAHYPQTKARVPVAPLYSAPPANTPLSDALFYSFRRVQRRRTDKEHRLGARSNYIGTTTYLSFREPGTLKDQDRVKTLSVRVLATNRHMTDQLPVRRDKADFVLTSDTSLEFGCITGPTSPRESLAVGERHRNEQPTGALLWKLVSLLQFNHLSIARRDSGDRAGGIRELMMVFADTADTSVERRIRGIVDVRTKPIVRKVKQESGFNAARGIEVTIEFDENAFEGEGVFLAGAVLDHFLADYSSLNSFTETVIATRQRGVIKRWPARIGRKAVL